MFERDQCTIYRSHLDAAKKMSPEEAGQFLIAAIQYSLDGTEPEGLSGVPEIAISLIRPTLEKSRTKAQSGKAGGKKNPEEKQQTIKPQATPKQQKAKAPEAVMPDISWAGPDLKSAILDWLRYKQERKEAYKPTGLNNLIRQLWTSAAERGEMAVAEDIRYSMANNWAGIHHENKGKTAGKGKARAQAEAWTQRVQAGSSGLTDWERDSIQRALFKGRKDGEAPACKDCNHTTCTEAHDVKCCAACEHFARCSTKCKQSMYGSGLEMEE